MNKNTFIFSVLFFFIGAALTYFIFGQGDFNQKTSVQRDNNTSSSDEGISVHSPFVTEDNSRLDIVENDLERVKQKLQEIEYAIANMPVADDADKRILSPASVTSNRPSPVFNRRIYNIENLVKGGIDAGMAEDIVRRKNSVELKKLELYDRAKREGYLDTQRYSDELESIVQQDVDLRAELGDESYDDYLFTSKQNNRIRIASVMLGSTAEQVGIQKDDIVISYDNQRMFSWQELKNATSEGQLGDYVSIDIYRYGDIYSFSVPRGPLGVQLGVARLEP